MDNKISYALFKSFFSDRNHHSYDPSDRTIMVDVSELEISMAIGQLEKNALEQNPDCEICRFSYRQYKEHYADCQTVRNTFFFSNGTISVLVPRGRMKASGVRGKHFHSFEVNFSDGTHTAYVAVDAEHAIDRARKEFPDSKTYEITSRLW